MYPLSTIALIANTGVYVFQPALQEEQAEKAFQPAIEGQVQESAEVGGPAREAATAKWEQLRRKEESAPDKGEKPET